MDNKEKHLRGVATELFAHMPLDYQDALQVIGHLRQLADWREQGVMPIPNADPDSFLQPTHMRERFTIVPFTPPDAS
jgi:hypothetical protein